MATIAGMLPDFPKKVSEKYIDVDFRQFEPRFNVSDDFYTSLLDFDLTDKILIEYEAYPFGGFVRDIYHNVTPKDLDLIIPKIKNLEALVLDLQQKDWQEVNIKSNFDYGQKLVFRLTKNGRQIDFVNSPLVIRPNTFDFYANAFAIDLELRSAFYWVKDYNVTMDYLELSDTFDTNFEELSARDFIRPKIQEHAFDILDQKLIVSYNKLRFVHAEKIKRLVANDWTLHLENFLTFARLEKKSYWQFVKEFDKISAEKKVQILAPYLTNKNELVRETMQFIIENADKCPGTIFIDALKLILKEKNKKLDPFKGIRNGKDTSSDERGG